MGDNIKAAKSPWYDKCLKLEAENAKLRVQLGECELVMEQEAREYAQLKARAELYQNLECVAREENAKLRELLEEACNDMKHHYGDSDLSRAIDALLEKKG